MTEYDIKDVNFLKKSNKVEFDSETQSYIFQCPHCDHFVEVGQGEVNCSIFRHAYFFQDTPHGILLIGQINPHASKQLCDQLIKEGKIYGCGKPVKMVRNGNSYFVEICDYI